MADTSNFRNGLVMRIGDQLYMIVEFQHVKPGKGPAFVRTKIKKIPEGAVIDKTFRAGEKIQEVRIDRKKYQYLYRADDLFYMMDTETYEQMPLSFDLVKDIIPFMKENAEVSVLMDGTIPLSVELPTFVQLEVVEADPGVRGDTAQGGAKPAKLETGATVSVPLFIEIGDILKVDTRTGRYIERV